MLWYRAKKSPHLVAMPLLVRTKMLWPGLLRDSRREVVARVRLPNPSADLFLKHHGARRRASRGPRTGSKGWPTMPQGKAMPAPLGSMPESRHGRHQKKEALGLGGALHRVGGVVLAARRRLHFSRPQMAHKWVEGSPARGSELTCKKEKKKGPQP